MMKSTIRCWLLSGLGMAMSACATGNADDVDFERRDPGALTWISPGVGETVDPGDVVVMSVGAGMGTSRVVHFAVDGTEVGLCDPQAELDDCHEGDIYSWSEALTEPGTHVLTTWFTVNNERVEARREIEVSETVVGGPVEPPASGMEEDPLVDPAAEPELPTEPESTTPEEGVEELEPGEFGEELPEFEEDAALEGPLTRGYLDPNRGWSNFFNGRQWAVRGQRIVVRRGSIHGNVEQAARCMTRFGESIRRYADLSRISRASMVALAIAESGCTNLAPTTTSRASGIFRMRATTCLALNPSLTRPECIERMHMSPDFAIETAARYLATRRMRTLHRNNPPRLAIAFHSGAPRRTRANRWHVVSPTGYLTRFIQGYNAYRSWETLGQPEITQP